VIDSPARAWRLIALDSDGDVNLLIQPWIDAGIDLLYPREVQAGMDPTRFEKELGRDLRLSGGVDKRALTQGKNQI
jgi:hypothetical protein